jgi:hypothetical protein
MHFSDSKKEKRGRRRKERGRGKEKGDVQLKGGFFEEKEKE